MTRIVSSFTALLLAAAMHVMPVDGARAADMSSATIAQVQGRVVNLGINKSMVIDLQEDVKDVLISNPQIADAVVRSSRKIYLMGMAVGEANVFLFGAGGRQIAQFELAVGRDTVALGSTIAEAVPGSHVEARTLGDSLVLSGTAPSAEGAMMAGNIAAKFMGTPDKIVNTITVAGSDQVNLRVVVAEVQRNTARQLGVDMVGLTEVGGVTFAPISTPSSNLTYNLANIANSTIGGSSDALYTVTDAAAKGAFGIGTSNFAAMVSALKTEGVLRTLAEPNLTAISGQAAKFVVGGEIPYVSTSGDTTTTNFRDYGIVLKFTPVVLSSGRISLNINTEISDIDSTLTVSGVPAITKRQAETTVELPSGGAIALGGLIKDNVTKAVSGLPYMTDVPILGSLFKSEAYKREQTELVIFVTPYLVKPVAPNELTRPDQNLSFQADAQGYFLHQVNRIYRANASGATTGSYKGRVGFSYE